MNPIQIAKAAVAANGKDNTDRPIQQIDYLGRDGDVEIFFPYGMHANVPKGFMGLLFSVLGQASNKIAMLSSPQERIRVKSGEVIFFHPVTKASTHYKNDGSIVTKTDNCTIVVKKDGKINIDSPEVTITGNLQVNGNINADGSIDAGTTISAGTSVTAPQVSGTAGLSGGGKSMVNHTHPAGSPPGNTGPNN